MAVQPSMRVLMRIVVKAESSSQYLNFELFTKMLTIATLAHFAGHRLQGSKFHLKVYFQFNQS